MNLHEHKEEFEELIAIVADYIGVPVDAVRRDYYIVQMMQNLQDSEYAEVCVFREATVCPLMLQQLLSCMCLTTNVTCICRVFANK